MTKRHFKYKIAPMTENIKPKRQTQTIKERTKYIYKQIQQQNKTKYTNKYNKTKQNKN